VNIEQWPTDRPQPYKRNARKITQKAIDKVAASIREFGFRQPIVVEPNETIIVVEANIRAVAPDVSYKAVRASRGKTRRAEPVAALYEQGRVHHVGAFAKLEDQMCSFNPADGASTADSPDRMDALVWGVTELVIDPGEKVNRALLREVEEISPI
jgi:phage terminase large subunit-like protein